MKKKKDLKTYDLILESARKIFAYFGIKKTTVDEIARKAGIGKGTIYNYYKSKDELFTAVIKREEQELKKLILEEIKKTEDPKEQLKSFILTKLKHLYNLKNFYRITEEALYEVYPETETIIKGYYEFEKKELAKILKNGINKKIFKSVNIMKTVKIIMDVMHSLELFWLRNKDNTIDKILKDAELLIDIFYEGLKKE